MKQTSAYLSVDLPLTFRELSQRAGAAFKLLFHNHIKSVYHRIAKDLRIEIKLLL